MKSLGGGAMPTGESAWPQARHTDATPIVSRRRVNKKIPFGVAKWDLETIIGLRLPAVVRERLVGFGHSVGVFLLLDGVPFTLARGDDLSGELLRHRLLVTAA